MRSDFERSSIELRDLASLQKLGSAGRVEHLSLRGMKLHDAASIVEAHPKAVEKTLATKEIESHPQLSRKTDTGQKLLAAELHPQRMYRDFDQAAVTDRQVELPSPLVRNPEKLGAVRLENAYARPRVNIRFETEPSASPENPHRDKGREVSWP